jgi:DNA-directed RNA polymerase subunit RPC12/RpoP
MRYRFPINPHQLCTNCHTPLINQAIVRIFIDGLLRCTTCHFKILTMELSLKILEKTQHITTKDIKNI